jgi:pyruvate decarboxylase
LNAGYAADGSARITGLGTLFTTYGVGELSAINAIAGSYAEHVPVVHVVGSPARQLQESGAILHHSLGDGRSGVFREIQEKVTVACSALWESRTAPQVIDDSIVKCLRESRPVYIDIPCDLVPPQVLEDRLKDPLKTEPTVRLPSTIEAS